MYLQYNWFCLVVDDQVYVPDTSLLEEYVLNDTGKIYTGNRKQINGKRWNFGQVILIKDGQIWLILF